MGMPTIVSTEIERTQAITDLIESVALQEAALSHILNAEGEKLQAFIKLLEDGSAAVTPETLLEVNGSVTDLVTSVSSVESHLQAKLALFAGSTQLSFYFTKKVLGSEVPLPGAVFELHQNETVIASATSDVNGVVMFQGIFPGVYTLSEVSAPPSYTAASTTYTVSALNSLNVSINGTAAEEFVVYNSQAANETFTAE